MNKTEETSSFYTAVSWLVKDRESRHRQYKWLQQEIDHIKLGLSLMNDSQRIAFREQFKGYQIIKALDGDESSFESCPIVKCGGLNKLLN